MLGKTRRLKALLQAVRQGPGQIAQLRDELDALRSRVDLGDDIYQEFHRARTGPEYQAAYDRAQPLVSVCIGTYNRARILTERCLPSVLSQDYPNLEIIVVGDGCTDDTLDRVRALGDPRLRVVNLPIRGDYPEDPLQRWFVAGTFPFNHALQMARGDFLTHLDDDDEFLPGRITTLVRLIQQERADLVWHAFWWEGQAGAWTLAPAERFAKGQVTTSTVLYHRWLTRIPWDAQAYRYLEPGDWNRFRKIKHLGARLVRCAEPLARHYGERANVDTR